MARKDTSTRGGRNTVTMIPRMTRIGWVFLTVVAAAAAVVVIGVVEDALTRDTTQIEPVVHLARDLDRL
jgi:hypothetical protein